MIFTIIQLEYGSGSNQYSAKKNKRGLVETSIIERREEIHMIDYKTELYHFKRHMSESTPC
jgi:hypothetical protein